MANWVHKQADVVPGHGDLLHTVGADPRHHQHGVAPGQIGHPPALGDGMAPTRTCSRLKGLTSPAMDFKWTWAVSPLL